MQLYAWVLLPTIMSLADFPLYRRVGFEMVHCKSEGNPYIA
jgi:hypothetical protein